jgi:hypothetical protein
MDPTAILDASVVNLANTATVFGQGAIASAISGNPFYSQDPAAANIATTTGIAPTVSSSSSSMGVIVLIALAYFLLR